MLFAEDINVPVHIFVTLGDTVMPSTELLAYAKEKNSNGEKSFLRIEAFKNSAENEHGVWCHDTPQNQQMHEAIRGAV
jgi:hypothetical protein